LDVLGAWTADTFLADLRITGFKGQGLGIISEILFQDPDFRRTVNHL
jgi:hypothetical protein